MAVDDIALFRARLPEAFLDASLPPGFDDDWMVIPLGSPEGAAGEDEALLSSESVAMAVVEAAAPKGRAPRLPELATKSAGSPVHRWRSPYAPPDAWAFYLPFHYYHPQWWGVYLSFEGTAELSKLLVKLTGGRLGQDTALHAARVFLYGHEAYHHSVEAFATRLEVTHRKPLYRTLGCEQHYRLHIGTDLSTEEALANAYALRKVLTVLRGPRHQAARKLVRNALLDYIKGCPPGYRLGGRFEKAKEFMQQQREFAEDNQHVAVGMPRASGEFWTVFPQAFTGISRVTSRVNYIVHRSSPLVYRLGLNLRYIQRRRIEQVLASQGCVLASPRGIHDKWKAPGGASIPVPRHTDIAVGTARSILQRAGLSGSVDAMLRS